MNPKLIDLATWLRANPVPRLDMNQWKVETSCGTTHCIIGWVAENQMFGFYFDKLLWLNNISFPSLSTWQAIAVVFDINQDIACQLFSLASNKGMTFDQIVDKIEAFARLKNEPKAD
jgi:hypothetical protein